MGSEDSRRAADTPMEYSVVLRHVCEVARDGFTACLRWEWKDGAVKGICFGEEVIFRRKAFPNRLSEMVGGVPWRNFARR